MIYYDIHHIMVSAADEPAFEDVITSAFESQDDLVFEQVSANFNSSAPGDAYIRPVPRSTFL
jgi:hypothetical protein